MSRKDLLSWGTFVVGLLACFAAWLVVPGFSDWVLRFRHWAVGAALQWQTVVVLIVVVISILLLTRDYKKQRIKEVLDRYGTLSSQAFVAMKAREQLERALEMAKCYPTAKSLMINLGILHVTTVNKAVSYGRDMERLNFRTGVLSDIDIRQLNRLLDRLSDSAGKGTTELIETLREALDATTEAESKLEAERKEMAKGLGI